jgi:hypothetical protein
LVIWSFKLWCLVTMDEIINLVCDVYFRNIHLWWLLSSKYLIFHVELRFEGLISQMINSLWIYVFF